MKRALVIVLVAALGILGARAPADEPQAAPALPRHPTDDLPFHGVMLIGRNGRGAEEWLRPKDGATLVRIPAGTFLRRPYEGQEASKPPVKVEVAGFFIDKHEVSNDQFAAFLNAPGIWPPGANEAWPGHPYVGKSHPRLLGDTHIPRSNVALWFPGPGFGRLPVTCAAGEGALAYARWARARLPRAVEWEKAAGGTDGRLYPWGNEPPDATRANFGRPAPHGLDPVGSYLGGASPYGVMDMAGNAYERVFGDGPRALAPVVIKGGSWLSPHPLNLRVLDLCVQGMDAVDGSVGFRCVMDDPEPHRPAKKPPERPVLRLTTDFDVAVKLARARRVPVFLALLYDTCGQCDRTREQVFKDPRFVAYANEHLVVVIGHAPGDAQLDPHPARENGSCPLYAGLTCDQHEILYARGLEVAGGFQTSPGIFLLHPDRIEKGAGTKALLIPEERFPKSGADVEGFLKPIEEGRRALLAEPK